jgi:hypothetical protein
VRFGGESCVEDAFGGVVGRVWLRRVVSGLLVVGFVVGLFVSSSVSALSSLVVRFIGLLARVFDPSPDVSDVRCTLNITCGSAVVFVVDGDVYAALPSSGINGVAEAIFVPLELVSLVGGGKVERVVSEREALESDRATGMRGIGNYRRMG